MGNCKDFVYSASAPAVSVWNGMCGTIVYRGSDTYHYWDDCIDLQCRGVISITSRIRRNLMGSQMPISKLHI